MEFNWSTIAWIAGLLFVYIFGLVEGRSKGYKKRKAEEEQEKQNRVTPVPEALTGIADDPGLLRIKNEEGALTLDLDGRRVNPVSLSPDQRKRLIEILNVMRPWLEGRSSPLPSAPGEPTPAVRPATLEQPAPPRRTSPPVDSPPSPSTPARAPQVSPPSARDSAASTAEKPSSAPRPAVIAKEDRPIAPANSIVSQIDSVLQARLAGTPLEERGIFLAESPQGTVNVYVGLTRYDGVDAVPDPEIKAAIRAAISEWEDKYTPGL